MEIFIELSHIYHPGCLPGGAQTVQPLVLVRVLLLRLLMRAVATTRTVLQRRVDTVP